MYYCESGAGICMIVSRVHHLDVWSPIVDHNIDRLVWSSIYVDSSSSSSNSSSSSSSRSSSSSSGSTSSSSR